MRALPLFAALSVSVPRGARLAIGVAILAWSSAASANQSYPTDVDMALGTPGIVESKIAPAKGCQLCHTDPNGGTTTLTPFANYMISQYAFPKTVVPEDALVAVSLAKLKNAEPKLWADMQKGIDPNGDPALAEQAPPQPSYGCSASARAHDSWPSWVGMLLAVTAAQAARSRARRSH